MDERLKMLSSWARDQLANPGLEPRPASVDASFRRYFRVQSGDKSYILMDAPPEHEDSAPYIHAARALLDLGLNVPEILAQDLGRGFLLLSDLGDRTYLSELSAANADHLYNDALAALISLQTGTCRDPDYFPKYSRDLLRGEMELFRLWYVPHRVGLFLSDEQNSIIDNTFSLLADAALAQPQVWVHRDYHSRNLMVTEHNNPGILDFQDAVLGPVAYDLVSLLRDCYITWPESKVDDWIQTYHGLALQAEVPITADEQEFRSWFDFIGVQRHIKVLGIFARLYHRDGKANYLDDLPAVLSYLLQVTAHHVALRPFHELLLDLHPEAS